MDPVSVAADGRCARSDAGIIAAAPPAEAYRTDLAEAALADLAGADTTGEAFVKGTVEVTPGGD